MDSVQRCVLLDLPRINSITPQIILKKSRNRRNIAQLGEGRGKDRNDVNIVNI